MLLLDPALGGLDRLVEPRMLELVALLETELLEDLDDPVRTEEAHQIVLERDVEFGRPRVALPRTAPAQLPVDAPRIVTRRTDHMQTAEFGDAGTELDVGAAPRHVGRHRDRAYLPGARHDLGLVLVVLGVEHVVRNIADVEHPRQDLRIVDRDRAQQHRLALGVALGDVVEDRLELLAFGLEDRIVVVLADAGAVGRDHRDVEFVDLVELRRLGLGGAGHARELFVHAEVVLDGDRRHRLRLLLDGDVLLGFERLMQTVGVAPPGHQPPGVLVDDQHLAVHDHVVDVLFEEAVRLEQLREVVQTLALGGEFILKGVLALGALGGSERVVGVDLVDALEQIGHDERLGVAGRDRLAPLLGQIRLVGLFVDGEVQRRLDLLQQSAVVVAVGAHVGLFDLLDELAVLEDVEQLLVRRHPVLDL